jgi:hypothetical protein
MFITNADVPVTPPVHIPAEIQVIRSGKTSIDCEISDGSVIRLRANTEVVAPSTAKVKCRSGGSIVAPIILPNTEQRAFSPRSLCQRSGRALYLIRPGQGRTSICAPKGVKAGIRG